MNQPFFYTTYETVQGSSGQVNHTARVRCANMGYGHRQDPIMASFSNFRAIGELNAAVKTWADSVEGELLTADQYLDRMTEQAELRALAKEHEHDDS